MWEHRIKEFGVKVDPEKKKAKREGPPVNFTGQGAKTERENTANVLLARQSPGWPVARELIADAIEHRADAVMLDYTATTVGVRYQVDGVWHNFDPRDRETGRRDAGRVQDGRRPQSRRATGEAGGRFAVEFKGTKRQCRFTSQGVPDGERVMIQMSDPIDRMWTFEELGMRTKLEEQLARGARPAPGHRALLGYARRRTDDDRSTRRSVRSIVSCATWSAVEDAAHREHEIQNVPITTFDSAAGETALTGLAKVIRSYPNVIVLRDLPDAETVGFPLRAGRRGADGRQRHSGQGKRRRRCCGC